MSFSTKRPHTRPIRANQATPQSAALRFLPLSPLFRLLFGPLGLSSQTLARHSLDGTHSLQQRPRAAHNVRFHGAATLICRLVAHGASGGAGTAAAQITRAMGLTVLGNLGNAKRPRNNKAGASAAPAVRSLRGR
jgi:NADPH:quinone reductase-like Zn-dependent oxidoreductase